MPSVNALTLRQSLGRVLKQLAKGGAPVIVEQRGKPAAALISLEDYQKRFVDVRADEQRRLVVQRIRALRFEAPTGATTLEVLRDIRGGK
jgi:prevent-host-death family protein